MNTSPGIRKHPPAKRWLGWLRPANWAQHRARARVDAVCIGYSGKDHWQFFQQVLQEFTGKKILILGVYYARDIAYMKTILKSLGREDVSVMGVDKFEDAACEDWPEELRGKSWREAGFGEAPARRKALHNLQQLGLDDHVTLQEARAEEFLQNTREAYDLIYIDTSHDYETTLKTIRLAAPRVAEGGMMAGDDFSDRGTWGVAQAVRETFAAFEVYADWIWCARPRDYIPEERG